MEVLTKALRHEKVKDKPNHKGKVKLCLFPDDKLLHIKPLNPPKNLQELINKLHKVSRFKKKKNTKISNISLH